MTPPADARLIVRCGRVESTQPIAFALAGDGAPDRTGVVADSQAAGRGRRGRVWQDEPGASLLVSILLRPRLSPANLPTLSLTAAVAVAEAVAQTAGLAAKLKWPNDVLVDGRKLAGILLETRLEPAGAAIVALGIGVNLAQRAFPLELAERATSVRLASGREVDRDTLLGALLERLDHWRGRLETEGFEPVRARWRELADTLGRPVSVDGIQGTAVDLDADGALIVADADGRRKRVVAGDVVEERA
jgi:BirA family transcriptional regulator, biotin operon repressor / biotin---[acetyl-CoA-carboxylase] ligase